MIIMLLYTAHCRIAHKGKAVFNFELHQLEYENAKVDSLGFNLHFKNGNVVLSMLFRGIFKLFVVRW